MLVLALQPQVPTSLLWHRTQVGSAATVPGVVTAAHGFLLGQVADLCIAQVALVLSCGEKPVDHEDHAEAIVDKNPVTTIFVSNISGAATTTARLRVGNRRHHVNMVLGFRRTSLFTW